MVVIDAAPGSLDPRFAISDYGVKISHLIFSSLVTVDNVRGEPEYDLAVAITNPSPTVYEVTLRRDAFFHDGHPVTAADVVYTFATLQEVGAPIGGSFEGISVQQVDDHTVRFLLPEPRAPFLVDLCLGIVPEHVLSPSGGTFGDLPLIGSGPFQWAGQQGEQEVVLQANPRYHGEAPYLTTVVFRLIRDTNTRLLAALGGTADLMQNAVPPLLLPVVQRVDDLVVTSGPSFKYTYLVFNLRHPILQDPRVRQAIAYAIDREEIIEQKFSGMARLATGLLAPDHWAYQPDVRRYPYDPELASRLLDQAGYPTPADGSPRFRLQFKVSSDKFRRSVATLIAHQLAQVGIAVEVQAYEWGTFFGDVRSGNFEMASLQWPSVIEPDLYRWIFHSSFIPSAENDARGANRGAYVNPEIDRLIERGRRTLERDERREIYGRIQQILAEELPYVSLWHEDNFTVTRRSVQGYQMTPNARFRYLTTTRCNQASGPR